MKVLVIGDVMLDCNHYCSSSRTAPENSAIPIYNIERTEYILGGAANVAKNLQRLNFDTTILTILGKDETGRNILAKFQEEGITCPALTDPSRRSTLKTRLFTNGTTLVNRHDYETATTISDAFEEQIFKHVCAGVPDAILLIDYNKGVLTETLCQRVIAYARANSIPTFVDPKVNNYTKYRWATCFKPNLREGQLLTGQQAESEIISSLRETLGTDYIVLTCGENGLYINEAYFPHQEGPNKVLDVTGAGDIAMCALVYIYLTDGNLKASTVGSRINAVCLKSIQCVGNYTLSVSDLYRPRVVFTNGCFDLIHSAHIKLLNFAKKQGDLLVVGINSDDSVRRLKGFTRPINSIAERVALLENLPMVDSVLVFDEDTPEKIIRALSPQVLVKGGDYHVSNIVGREFVDEVILFDYIENTSTTRTIARING